MADKINDEPFSINVDEYGTPSIDPPIANGYMCWYQYIGGKLCYCCWTPAGLQCYCTRMQILDQPPEDPGPPAEQS